MKLTVTICTYNRSELLLKTLASINNASIPDSVSVSILVIANACSDDTLAKLKDYQNRQVSKPWLPLTFAQEPKPGKSNALNKALTLISKGWVCFIDDDHRLDKHYFQAVSDAIAQFPETTLFCGKIIPDWTGQEPAWAHEQGEFKITPFPVPYFDLGNEPLTLSGDNSIPGGGNLIAAHEVFRRIGGFSANLGPQGHDLMGGEDSDFVLRALNGHETLRYIPHIVQYHYVNPLSFKLIYVMRKSFQRNRSITLAHQPERAKIPHYLWGQLIRYCAGALFSFKPDKIRFFLTRLAGVLGQMFGTLQSKIH
ncbi:MAG: glycosyl transferase family 2 [Gammaproteobacteria bacterium HGW-Gammaproteobacteria-3]|nr:MAG: glycosyl transferase family 2 [Gammaproteobacteria bacterium HGW-Gammaproteobacteria-3]